MEDLISEWRSSQVEVEPETVIGSEHSLEDIKKQVRKMSEAQKKNFLYRMLAQTHAKGSNTTREEMESIILTTIKIMRHYESLKAQRDKFSESVEEVEG